MKRIFKIVTVEDRIRENNLENHGVHTNVKPFMEEHQRYILYINTLKPHQHLTTSEQQFSDF